MAAGPSARRCASTGRRTSSRPRSAVDSSARSPVDVPRPGAARRRRRRRLLPVRPRRRRHDHEGARSKDDKSAQSKLADFSPNTPVSKRPAIFLLIGQDRRKELGETRGRSDTLMLVRIDPKKQIVSMLSFPRDWIVDVPGYAAQSITDSFSLGGPAARPSTRSSSVDRHHAELLRDGRLRCVHEDGGRARRRLRRRRPPLLQPEHRLGGARTSTRSTCSRATS